jgi:hypothetical protein
MKWDNFEKEVRKIASIRWSRPCYKETIIGIEIDGVLRLDENHYKLIQITQNEKLEKFRKDIGDLDIVRNELFHKNYISSDLYIITEEEISSRMLETATAKRVSALTFLSFKNEFFNYESYKYERGRKPFGSAVIPETGEQENNNFIQVDYINSLDDTHITFGELIKHLVHGKKIILKGEYGTGKSRLIQALFFDLIKKLNNEYVLAIDLRDYKGVISDEELIRRHMSKFGLAENADNCIKCLNNGSFIF